MREIFSLKKNIQVKILLIAHLSILLSGTIHHMTVIYGRHLQNDNIFRCFFHFFKILIFWAYRGVKGQKMVQNDKTFCLLCSISQEPYIIWLSFMLQMCKMIISQGVFFNFKILILWVVGAERAKNGLKWQKNLPIALNISGIAHHMIVI